jgi:hypothetical protein
MERDYKFAELLTQEKKEYAMKLRKDSMNRLVNNLEKARERVRQINNTKFKLELTYEELLKKFQLDKNFFKIISLNKIALVFRVIEAFKYQFSHYSTLLNIKIQKSLMVPSFNGNKKIMVYKNLNL